MREAAAVACVLVLSAGCRAAEPRTQVMVIVDADSEVQAAAIRASVRVTGGTSMPDALRHDDVIGDAAAPVRFPITVGIVPLGGDVRRVFRVEVTALDGGGGSLGTVRAASGFIAGRTLELRLRLEACCRTITCELDETCRRCGCIDARVEPDDLPRFPADATPPDADRADAGGDAAAPDADVPDAASPDGGAGPCMGQPDGTGCSVGVAETCCGGTCIDTDADPQHCGGCGTTCAASTPRCVGRSCAACASAADCDDGVDCTVDECLSGGACSRTPLDSRCPPSPEPCAGSPICTETGCDDTGAPNGTPCRSGMDICWCLFCWDIEGCDPECDLVPEGGCWRPACQFAGACT